MRIPLLIAAALLLAACGKSPDEVAVSAMSGGKVDKDGDKLTVQTDQGAVTFNAAEGQPLPANFPKDVFLPKDYSVRSSMEQQGTSILVFENEAQMVQYSVMDDEPGKAHVSVAITKKGQ